MSIQTITRIKPESAAIRKFYASSRASNPNQPESSIAAALGISELDLLAAHIGFGVTRIRPDWQELLSLIPPIGPVHATTANAAALLSATGDYPPCRYSGPLGIVDGSDIQLKMLLQQWGYAFLTAFPDPATGRRKRSIQIFDRLGGAIHRIWLTPASSLDAFEEIAERLVHSIQAQVMPVAIPQTRFSSSRHKLPGAALDHAAFLDDWQLMSSNDDFWRLRQKHRLSRMQAVQAAEGRFTRRVRIEALPRFLRSLVDARLPVRVALGNRGCVQSVSSRLRRFADVSGWLSIVNDRTRIQLHRDRVTEVWDVLKPFTGGLMRSLEVFDDRGLDAAAFVPASGITIASLDHWQNVLDGLPACSTT